MKYLLALLLLFASPAWADWTLVTDNDNGTKFYIDYSTIRKDGNLRKVWEVTDFKNPETFNGLVYLSVRARAEYDCKEERKRTLTTTAHSGLRTQGSIVWRDELPSNWNDAPPRSAMLEMLQRVCRAPVP
jgi:hypothetical protein